MRTTRPSRGRRALRAALVAAAAALGLVVAPASLAPVHASFTAKTGNTGDSFAADQLQPPAGLSATQTCTTTPAVTHGPASGGVGTTSVSITPPPAGAGDLLVAHIAQRGGLETVTPPTGWTQLRQDTSGGVVTSEIFWKIAVAGEPAAVFSRSASSTGQMAGGVIAFSGVPVAPIVTSNSAAASTATATMPSVTTSRPTAEVVHFLSKRDDTLPAPSGTTFIGSLASGTGSTVGITAADETYPSPGTVTGRTATSTSSLSSEWVAQSMVIRRVPGAPTAHLTWTPSTSTWATGYLLERVVGGSTQANPTISGASTASTTDGPLADATTYTYRLTSYRGNWRSSTVTAPLTTNC